MSLARVLDVGLTTVGILVAYHSLQEPMNGQWILIAGVCLGVGISGLVRRD